ncbi:MAG: hypothetical protein KIG69_04970 [Eubacteriales bacterium]|nr:hypothetical protein [Eubacteriales bacterium]
MKSGNKKHNVRIAALIAAVLALCLALTGCMMGSGKQPSINAEDDSTVAYADRQLTFAQNVQSIQVNVNTAVGFFCYEDNMYKILTDKTDSGSDALDTDASDLTAAPDAPKADTAEDNTVKYTVELFEKDKDGNLSETPASSDKFTYEINEKNGYLFVKSSVLGEIRINASCANGSELKETVKLNVNRQSVSLFDIVMFVIGLYLLYSAISGRGRIFDAEFVKEGMEAKHKKAMRISCLAAAVIMIAAGVVSALDGFGKLQTVSMILFGLLCAVFVAAIIWTGKYVDKNAKREAQQQPGGGTLRAPKAAFEFDDDEPTIDDVKK